MIKDVYNDVTIVQNKACASVTADINCTAIDTWDYGAKAVTLIAVVGTGTTGPDASNYFDIEVEHSDDNSTWADCADADLSNSVTGTNTGTFAVVNAADEDDLSYATQYVGGKRYVRVVLNETGTAAVPIGVIAIHGGKRYASGA